MALQLYKIATVEVGSAGATSIDFTSIPQGYTDLILEVSARISTTGTTILSMQFNGDTTSANYTNRYLEGNGATASSSTLTPSTNPGIWAGNCCLSTDTANAFGSSTIYIPNYTSSNQKSVSYDGVSENNATTAYTDLTASRWTGTAAISSISIKIPATTVSINQYSTATLYGIL